MKVWREKEKWERHGTWEHRRGGCRGDRRGEDYGDIVSLYVDNLPTTMSKGWLWQLFKCEGRVVDAYVSHKRRKHTTNLFGFVRFLKMEEAQRAIKRLHGVDIRG